MFYKLTFVFTCAMLLHFAAPCNLAAEVLPAPDKTGNWGYIDSHSGEVVIPPKYSRVGMFHNGYAVIRLSFPQSTYAIWDKQGERVEVFPQGDGIIDANGNSVLPPVNGQFVIPASPYAEQQKLEPAILPGLYEVQKPNGRGVWDASSGWILAPGDYDDIRFLSDGSFIFGGSTYISAAPDRNIYFSPNGYVIAEADLENRVFLLEDHERVATASNYLEERGFVALSLWTGEMVSKTPYKRINYYARCGRWAGITLSGRVDVFELSGEVVRSIATDLLPAIHNNGGITLRRDAEALEFDPCSLEEGVGIAAPHLQDAAAAEPEFRVVLHNKKTLLLDVAGRERIPPNYEMLLPAGGGYWWGRYDDSKWILIDASTGREIRMP